MLADSSSKSLKETEPGKQMDPGSPEEQRKEKEHARLPLGLALTRVISLNPYSNPHRRCGHCSDFQDELWGSERSNACLKSHSQCAG